MIIDDIKIDFGYADKTIQEEFDQGTATIMMNYLHELANSTAVWNDDLSFEKLTILYTNYIKLDGTFKHPEKGKKYNIGYTVDNASHTSNIITVQFSKPHFTYATVIKNHDDYGILSGYIIYTLSNGTTKRIDIGGNNYQPIFSHVEYIENFTKVQIYVTEWNRPNRAGEIKYIQFALNDKFKGSDIISVSSSMTNAITSENTPSGELTCSVFDPNREFLISEFQNISPVIKDKVKASVYIKRNNENIYRFFGDYYTSETLSTEDNMVTTFTGYDYLSKLNDSYFSTGVVTYHKPLSTWLQEAFTNKYGFIVVPDASMGNIYSSGYITEVPTREAVRLVLEAANCVAYYDRDLNRIVATTLSEYESLQSTIQKNQIVANTLQYEDNNILGVDVTAYDYSAVLKEQGIGYIAETVIGQKDVEIPYEIVYSNFPVDVSTVQVFIDTTQPVINTRNLIYSDKIIVYLTALQPNVSTFITVTGCPYSVIQTHVIRGQQAETRNRIIQNNYLITNVPSLGTDLGARVADYQYKCLYNQKNFKAELFADFDIWVNNTVKMSTEEKKHVVQKVIYELSSNENYFEIEGITSD